MLSSSYFFFSFRGPRFIESKISNWIRIDRSVNTYLFVGLETSTELNTSRIYKSAHESLAIATPFAFLSIIEHVSDANTRFSAGFPLFHFVSLWYIYIHKTIGDFVLLFTSLFFSPLLRSHRSQYIYIYIYLCSLALEVSGITAILQVAFIDLWNSSASARCFFAERVTGRGGENNVRLATLSRVSFRR